MRIWKSLGVIMVILTVLTGSAAAGDTGIKCEDVEVKTWCATSQNQYLGRPTFKVPGSIFWDFFEGGELLPYCRMKTFPITKETRNAGCNSSYSACGGNCKSFATITELCRAKPKSLPQRYANDCVRFGYW